MDRFPTINETARHLIAMADNPLTSGKEGHAALRLKELMASHEMFAVLPEVIAQERERMKQEVKK